MDAKINKSFISEENKKNAYKLFLLNNTKNRNGIDLSASFFRKYGKISVEAAFEIYWKEICLDHYYYRKIEAFENFLISKGIKSERSNISESRYYHYNGVKYRFSSHIYPTGSMTNEILKVVDFAADPELIENITF